MGSLEGSNIPIWSVKKFGDLKHLKISFNEPKFVSGHLPLLTLYIYMNVFLKYVLHVVLA